MIKKLLVNFTAVTTDSALMVLLTHRMIYGNATTSATTTATSAIACHQ